MRKPTVQFGECTNQSIEDNAHLLGAVESVFTCYNCKHLGGVYAPITDSGRPTISDAELLALVHGVSIDEVIVLTST